MILFNLKKITFLKMFDSLFCHFMDTHASKESFSSSGNNAFRGHSLRYEGEIKNLYFISFWCLRLLSLYSELESFNKTGCSYKEKKKRERDRNRDNSMYLKS